MHIHLPKPLHGWREFLGEVGIIVVGVLIALGAEQTLEHWHLEGRVDEAHAAIRSELQKNYTDAWERIAVERCVNSQADWLIQHLLTSTGRNVPTPVEVSNHLSYVLRAPSRAWTDASWLSAIADGVRARFDDNERRTLDEAYSLIRWMRELNQEEVRSLADLAVLSYPIELDANVKAQFLTRIAAVRIRNGRMVLIAHQLVEDLNRMGYGAPAGDVRAAIESSRRDGTLSWCMRRNLPS